MASERKKQVKVLNAHGDVIGVRYATVRDVKRARRKKRHLKPETPDDFDLQTFTNYREGGA